MPTFVRTTIRTVWPFLTVGRLMPPTGRPLTAVIEITTGLTAADAVVPATGIAIATSAIAVHECSAH